MHAVNRPGADASRSTNESLNSAQGEGALAPRPTGYATVPCISSDQLLAGASEIHIAHRGALYRLKQTSLGKLILTK